MDRPPPDPQKLLDFWMEWERGETPPGRVISNMKTHGLRDLLEQMVADEAADGGAAATSDTGTGDAETVGDVLDAER